MFIEPDLNQSPAFKFTKRWIQHLADLLKETEKTSWDKFLKPSSKWSEPSKKLKKFSGRVPRYPGKFAVQDLPLTSRGSFLFE